MQFQTEIMVNFISQKFYIISSKYINLMQLTITQQSYSKNLSLISNIIAIIIEIQVTSKSQTQGNFY